MGGDLYVDNRAEYIHRNDNRSFSLGGSVGATVTRSKPIIWEKTSLDGKKKHIMDEEQMLYGATASFGIQKEFGSRYSHQTYGGQFDGDGMLGAKFDVTVGNGLAANVKAYGKKVFGQKNNYYPMRFNVSLEANYLDMGIFSNPEDKTKTNARVTSAIGKTGLETRIGRNASLTVYGNIGLGVQHTSANMPVVKQEIIDSKPESYPEKVTYKDILYNPDNNPNQEFERTSLTYLICDINTGFEVDIPLGNKNNGKASLSPFFDLNLTGHCVDKPVPFTADFKTGVKVKF